MKIYRDQGIVLRTQKLGESDRIATVFFKHHGVKRLVAKGVRKTSSKFGASLEPFMLVDLQGYTGRSLDTVTQSQIIEGFGEPISTNFDVFLDANILVETAEKINDADHSMQQFELLRGALRALASKRISSNIIRDAYLARAISLAGWAPQLDRCVNCGIKGDFSALSISQGGTVCDACRINGAFKLSHDTIHLLKSYLEGEWQKTLSFSTGTYQQAAGLLSAYLQWHLEKNLKSITVSQRALAAR